MIISFPFFLRFTDYGTIYKVNFLASKDSLQYKKGHRNSENKCQIALYQPVFVSSIPTSFLPGAEKITVTGFKKKKKNKNNSLLSKTCVRPAFPNSQE